MNTYSFTSPGVRIELPEGVTLENCLPAFRQNARELFEAMGFHIPTIFLATGKDMMILTWEFRESHPEDKTLLGLFILDQVRNHGMKEVATLAEMWVARDSKTYGPFEPGTDPLGRAEILGFQYYSEVKEEQVFARISRKPDGTPQLGEWIVTPPVKSDGDQLERPMSGLFQLAKSEAVGQMDLGKAQLRKVSSEVQGEPPFKFIGRRGEA